MRGVTPPLILKGDDDMEWTPIVDCAYDAVITPGDAHATTVATTIQLKDYAGNNLTVPAAVIAYLSEDADGLDFNDVTLTADLSASVGYRAILLAYKSYLLVSTAAGAITVSIQFDDNADDFYLIVVMPDGRRVVSSKIEIE